MSALPLVSGIMAAYNYERYVAEALDSALAQDYPEDRLELIVVDDGSTDGTSEIARSYAERSAGRIRYIRQDNAGLIAATVRGLQEARGDLITLLDADDVWLASRTRLLVAGLERNPAAGLVYGDMEVIDADGRTLAPSWLEEAAQTPFRGRTAAELLRSNFVIAPSFMVRAQLRERFCPMPAEFAVQDWYIAARVAEVAEIDFVPAPVARYRRHGANMINGRLGPAEIAKIWTREFATRRWLLANLRSPELTVEDLVDAHSYFTQTYQFVARVENDAPERLLEVTDAGLAEASNRVHAGRMALAGGRFVESAGHFAAALAADPFDRSALEGLDYSRRRLIVPLPLRAGAPSGSDYRLKPGYMSRPAPECFVDLVEDRDGIVRQPDVYARAADVATALGATRIIDLGAGAGGKLVALAERFDVLGLDYGPNVELARRRFPALSWGEHDLDTAGALSLTPEQLDGSVVICANVIEHLRQPEVLLENLRVMLPSIEALVISTPDRDLTSGPDDFGPPADRSRVREWNIQEFAALLEAWGFEHGELGLTRANNAGEGQTTILATLCPDAARAERIAAPLRAAA